MTKRLLLLVTDLLIGGTPTVVRELALRLHSAGVDVQVACLAPWGPTADQIQEAGVKVTALEARGVSDWRVLSRLVSLIQRERIDVVFSSLVHANVAAAMAKLRLRHLQLYQSIQTTQARPRWHWLAQAAAGRLARGIIVPSESTARALRIRSCANSAMIKVIPNGVDLESFANLPHTAWEDGKIRVGFIGRLDPIKHIPDAVDAIANLPEQYELHVYGAGRDETRIRQRIAFRKVEDRVILHGSIPDPRPALVAMDLLVLPSAAEGFGLVLIEAMAAGVPVVATDAPGIRDVVTDGKDGLLVPVGHSAAMAMAIRRLSTDLSFRQQVTEAGRQTVAGRYSWEKIVPMYRAVLGV